MAGAATATLATVRTMVSRQADRVDVSRWRNGPRPARSYLS
jgi:hypothetical protein